MFQSQCLGQFSTEAVPGICSNKHPHSAVHWYPDRVSIRGDFEWPVLFAIFKGLVRYDLFVRCLQIHFLAHNVTGIDMIRYILGFCICAVIWFINGKEIIESCKESSTSEIYLHTDLGVFLSLITIEWSLGIF